MLAYIRPCGGVTVARRALMGLALLNLITSCGVVDRHNGFQSLKEPV
jgi:hypothetical protein